MAKGGDLLSSYTSLGKGTFSYKQHCMKMAVLDSVKAWIMVIMVTNLSKLRVGTPGRNGDLLYFTYNSPLVY